MGDGEELSEAIEFHLPWLERWSFGESKFDMGDAVLGDSVNESTSRRSTSVHNCSLQGPGGPPLSSPRFGTHVKPKLFSTGPASRLAQNKHKSTRRGDTCPVSFYNEPRARQHNFFELPMELGRDSLDVLHCTAIFAPTAFWQARRSDSSEPERSST